MALTRAPTQVWVAPETAATAMDWFSRTRRGPKLLHVVEDNLGLAVVEALRRNLDLENGILVYGDGHRQVDDFPVTALSRGGIGARSHEGSLLDRRRLAADRGIKSAACSP